MSAVPGFFLAALLSSPAWGSIPPQPGTVNYVEGQAAIGGQPLSEKAVGSERLEAGQTLSTQNGRAEILLTPGIFLRVGDHSVIQMNSPGLADTITTLQKGRAMVEVAEIRPENNVRITEDGASVKLQKPGLYDFDADHGLVRVYDGKADVQAAGRDIEVKGGHQLDLDAAGKLKAHGFDKKAYEGDDFYRWARLRSSYLAEANVDAARTYAGGSGWAPGVWNGAGWYWNPGIPLTRSSREREFFMTPSDGASILHGQSGALRITALATMAMWADGGFTTSAPGIVRRTSPV